VLSLPRAPRRSRQALRYRCSLYALLVRTATLASTPRQALGRAPTQARALVWRSRRSGAEPEPRKRVPLLPGGQPKRRGGAGGDEEEGDEHCSIRHQQGAQV
jgi:hypothetical protein